ncbi:hypothetical protein AB4305_01845 [Nocardia sp. 2YAB30]|uniref:hypothetical protein n=1 Tax=unclassified Nocardia TaxID=2637762 RepID=UPI003F96E7BC
MPAESAGTTKLGFSRHLPTDAEIAHVGPDLGCYLDMLGAARSGTDHPDFGEYYPAMHQYYEQPAD